MTEIKRLLSTDPTILLWKTNIMHTHTLLHTAARASHVSFLQFVLEEDKAGVIITLINDNAHTDLKLILYVCKFV